MDESDQMPIYFAKAKEKFLQDQHRRPPRSMLTDRPTPTHNVFGECIPDTEMESADSYDSHGNAFDPDDLDIDDLRRPHLATTEAITGEGLSAQRICMSTIAELKKYSGCDRDIDRAQGWVQKVRSAFLHDQAPESLKCLFFCLFSNGSSTKLVLFFESIDT